MGCQSVIVIGDNLTFSVCTHDPDTGVLTDADNVPTYRVYEDETSTAILTGSMAKLDDVNTTGFYTEQIACTSANGFENGKSYTIYISATVDSDTGGICYGFTVVRSWTQVASVAASVDGGLITIRRGDTLSAELTGMGDISSYVTLDFTVKRKLSDADAAAIIRIRKNQSGSNDGLMWLNEADASARASNGSITIDDSSAGDITIALAAAETDDLVVQDNLRYDVQMITSSAVSTKTEGNAEVTADVTRLIS